MKSLPKEVSTQVANANEWKNYWYGRQLEKDIMFQHPNIPILNVEMDSFYYFGMFFALVVDYDKFYYPVVRGNTAQILGYSHEMIIDLGYDFLLSRIHPDDLPRVLSFAKVFFDFLAQVPLEERTKYKVSLDFRLRRADESYAHLHEQMKIIQFDSAGNPCYAFKFCTDISHLITTNYTTSLAILNDHDPLDRYMIAFHHQTDLLAKTGVSKKEKEILRLLSGGLSSVEIAERLFISTHTVNTHRKNMLKKTQVNNTSELVGKAIQEGWI